MSDSGGGGTLYLIFIQVASRALTFIGNQILLRYVSPSLLGIAVQLELVSVTILYSARESLRVALQRVPSSAEPVAEKKNDGRGRANALQSTVNVAYLAVALGVLIGLPSGYWYLRSAENEVLLSPLFLRSFTIYTTATLVELLAEPFFIVIQQHALYKARARAETSGAIARCLFAVSTAIIGSRSGHNPSVLPFAIGQLAYSVTLFTLYFHTAASAFSNNQFSLLPRPIGANSTTYALNLFSKPLLSLASTLYLQSIFKLLLTQGDALILSFLASLASQGAFALASNYGGLLARLIFQPIEESSRNTFGRLLSSTPSTDTVATTHDPTSKTFSSPHSQLLTYLSTLLHLYTLASLPLLLLAPPLLPHLTPYILSPSFRSPSTIALLQTYIAYIPLMALNGILDAFFVSAATQRQLQRQSLFMAGCTVVYAGVAWVLLSGGASGAANVGGARSVDADGDGGGAVALIQAGCINMILRIAFVAWFVDRWIQQNVGKEARMWFWRRSMPEGIVVAGAVGVGAVMWWYSGQRQQQAGKDVVRELATTGAAAVVMAGIIFMFEAEFLLNLVEPVVPTRFAWVLWPLRAVSETKGGRDLAFGKESKGRKLDTMSKQKPRQPKRAEGKK